ncbi:MAG: hypothetical protein CMK09_05120 [Ponticaulis sp.]|nr:hypothetical protein [Ponticaulis sp.]|tara:strand:+ start:927 stop:2108 length:1182 start_codon:yes stop_codon:yes gene_type:complete
MLILGHQAISQTQSETEVDCGPDGSYLVAANAEPALEDLEKLRQVLGAVSNFADACPGNNFAQYYASKLWYNGMEMQIRGGAPIEQSWASWQRAFSFNEAFYDLSRAEQSRKANVPDSFRELELSSTALNELREALVKRGLEFGLKVGKSNEFMTAEQADQCPARVSTDANAMNGWAAENPEYAVQIAAMAERYEPACRAVEDPLTKYGLRLYFARLAKIRLLAAEQSLPSDPERARAFILKVKDHRDSVVAQEDYSITDWNDYSSGAKLAELSARLPAIRTIPTATDAPLVSSGRVPVDDWFTGEHPPIAVMESIGSTMNSYVVETDASGFIRVIGKTFALFNGKPEEKSARSLLYAAAKAYAEDGSYRTIETVDTPISHVGYDWLQDYQSE